MHQILQAIVDDFGRGYAKFGHSELLGRVVGLLICASEPLTEEQISKALNVSKSPINQITSRLEELNLVRRVRIQGQRKFYYQISRDVFLKAAINLSRLIEYNLRVAENHLEPLLRKYKAAGKEEKAKLRPVCQRLIAMREFHLREIAAYKKLLEDWQAAKNQLSSVEEYLETWVIKEAS
jgi:DNA-binding transcriptional regulator GbsR (MarR family)